MSGWTKQRVKALEAEIMDLEFKLALPPEKNNAAASIANIDQQIEYWRKRQALASHLSSCGRTPGDKKRGTDLLRMAAGQLLDWEKRRSVALKALEGDKLDECLARLAEMQRASGKLDQIET